MRGWTSFSPFAVVATRSVLRREGRDDWNWKGKEPRKEQRREETNWVTFESSGDSDTTFVRRLLHIWNSESVTYLHGRISNKASRLEDNNDPPTPYRKAIPAPRSIIKHTVPLPLRCPFACATTTTPHTHPGPPYPGRFQKPWEFMRRMRVGISVAIPWVSGR